MSKRLSRQHIYVGMFENEGLPVDILPKVGGPLRQALHGTAELAQKFQQAVAKVSADPNYSQRGIRNAIQSFYDREMAPTIAKHKEAIAHARAVAQGKRENLAAPAVDPNNVVAELQRQELRTWLRGMEPSERTAKVMMGSQALREAVVHAPAELSGVSEDLRGKVYAEEVQRANADAIDEIQRIERSAAIVEEALNVTVEDVHKAAQEARSDRADPTHESATFSPGLRARLAALS